MKMFFNKQQNKIRELFMNLKNLADRINFIMLQKGITQEELAMKIGVSQPAVQKIVSGKTLQPRNILDIALALDVDVHWLKKGDSKTGNPSAKEYHNLLDDGILPALVTDINKNHNDEEVEVLFYNSIEIAAKQHGNDLKKTNNYDKIKFNKSFLIRKKACPKNVICFPILGNSMIPILPDGTIVAVDINNRTIKDGSLYAICHGGLYRVKVLYALANNKVRIRSYNITENQDENVSMKEVEVIGKVFWYAVDVN